EIMSVRYFFWGFSFIFMVSFILSFYMYWMGRPTQQVVYRRSEGNKIELTWQEAELLFIEFVSKKTYNCTAVEAVGSTSKSSYGEGIHLTCMDKTYQPKSQCIVYSFGIANIWNFEESLAGRGCQVFAFDPSMNTESHKRMENLWFYNIGLGRVDSDNFTPRVDQYVKESKLFTWKVRTMKSIMEMLGHTNKMIDVLKMDIEGYEFDVISSMIDDGTIKQMRQYVGEWHIFGDQKYDYPTKYSIAKQLWSYGFKTFNAGVHPRCDKYCFQIDLGFVNTKLGK
ncbi:unnamed protein product, partial [Owenia fusiformis]